MNPTQMARDRLKTLTRSDTVARTRAAVRPRFGMALVAAVGLAGSLAACEGCHATKAQPPASAAEAANVGPSTLRFYIVSDLAGALEPCGCVKDQLGGLDHAAAWMASEKAKSAASALVTAGPLFFLDPVIADEKRSQEVAKAETLAKALKQLGFAAFAPGRNDWAGGPAVFGNLASSSGGAVVFGNATAEAAAAPFATASHAPYVVREMNGVKVAFIGVSRPDADKEAPPVSGLGVTPAVDAVRAAADAAEKEGAKVTVVLASVGRGEAKRIADAVPSLTAIVVGSPGHAGDVNTKTPPFDAVDKVIIAETGNHLQTMVVLDLFVRDGGFAFADASGSKAPPAKGSFFRYAIKEIREGMGKDPAVTETLLAYYKRVNEENRRELAGRKPRPVEGNQAFYMGVAACEGCHSDAVAFWKKTKHAGAYATLSTQFKEFNLDCVACHVTGYDRPGGTTVTHVDDLTNVQCEVCHGPGSNHVRGGGKAAIVGHPKTDMCLECHHPPHVNEFDANAKLAEILGPGHGRPMK